LYYKDGALMIFLCKKLPHFFKKKYFSTCEYLFCADKQGVG
jgi:hypothetical protein